MILASSHPLTIVPATTADLDTVMTIYDEAARWLHSLGYTYWDYPQSDRIRNHVKSDIENDRVYLCRAAQGKTIGTFRLLWSDPNVWPAEAANAGYIHGLVTRREYKGQGIGRFMLDWVKDYVRAQGKQFLRLDCDSSNATLRAYYERYGFSFCGEAVMDTYVGARYELALT